MKHLKLSIIILVLLIAGCSPGQHHGRIIIHDANNIEVIFDVPMSIELERNGIKVKASSLKSGLFEDIIKFFLVMPR